MPTFIATGPDGNVWFTEEIGNNIVRLDPANPGDQTEFPLLTEVALPWDISIGPDGNLWFTELAGRHIGKITPDGTITEYPVPASSGSPESPPTPSGDSCGSPRTTRATSARSRSTGDVGDELRHG